MYVDVDLVRRYNVAGPRYTSYPTAPHFVDTFDAAAFRGEVDRTNGPGARDPISLYLHLPFCRQLCYYCGCHMKITQRPETIAKYLRYLKREIDLVAETISPQREVTQIHWGGGTSTYLPPEQLEDLGRHLQRRFAVTDDAEISIEADPRTVTDDHLVAARSVGFNRISLGVQDFDLTMQQAINRVQSLEQDGLVLMSPDTILVTDSGRLLVRNVAMAFDAYFHQGQRPSARPVYSNTV